MFEKILGNESVKAYLRKRMDQLPHALLFSGPDGIGKSLFAKEITSHLLKDAARIEKESHPDFHVFRPEGKSALHTMETLKGLIDVVHEAPFEASAKIFLIHDAHRMQPAVANAFLKTLEEPEPDTLLLLLTSKLQEILPTIVSRCSVVKFQPLTPKEFAGITRGIMPFEESLFQILSQKPNYPELMQQIEKIEEEADCEDPMKKTANCECIFSTILMWHRDQIARVYGAPLFFPDAPAATTTSPTLSHLEKLVDDARLAVSRNIRLSHSLEKIFLC